MELAAKIYYTFIDTVPRKTTSFLLNHTEVTLLFGYLSYPFGKFNNKDFKKLIVNLFFQLIYCEFIFLIIP